MKLFVGLDVSLEMTAICVISEHGKILKEAQVASEPESLCAGSTIRTARSQLSGWRPVPCRSGCIAGYQRQDNLSC